MKAPPLLLGSTILFWGYYSNLLLVAIFMAISIELKPLIKWRHATSNNNFYAIGDVSTVILVLIAIIAFFFNSQRLFIYQIVAWLPFAFYFLMLTETYSDRDKTPLGAFIYRYRKLSHSTENEISLGYLYFFLCLLSASATVLRSEWFFLMALILLAYGLWSQKSASTHPLRWSMIFLFTGGIGFVAEIGLFKLHQIVEELSIDLIDSLLDSERDPFQMTTAMGRVGKLKLSNKIIMRIQASNDNILSRGQPFLLQESAYNVFNDNAWFNIHTTFEAVIPTESNNAWLLTAPISNAATTVLQIYKQKSKSRGLLAVPASSFKIQAHSKLLLSKSKLGALQYRATPELEQYRVHINTDESTGSKKDPKPTKTDLLIPVNQRSSILDINKTLHTDSSSSEIIIKNIKQYFSAKYTYSTYLKPSSKSSNPLVYFLRRSHSGHCEYFASATVLLLRAAGIPARYSVGYSVQEYDNENSIYIVRARHRHAWAKAYIDGAWVNVDTTPAAWFQADQETASVFEPVTDWISHQFHQIKKWQNKNSNNHLEPLIYVLIISSALLLYLIIRLGKQQWRGKAPTKINNTYHITESAYTRQIQRVLDALKLAGVTWKQHEPLLARAKSCHTFIKDSQLYEGLNEIINFYYQLRFDQQPSTRNTRDISLLQLENKIDVWLTKFEINTNQNSN